MKATKKEKVQTAKQAKTVNLSTYLQSIVITALIVGVASWVGSYFNTINMNQNARASVVSDMQIIKNTTSKE